MKKYITIIAAIAALVAISCTREELPPEEGRSLPEFTVCVSRGDCTRSTLDSESGTPLWKTGDRVWVSDGTKHVCSVVSSDYNGEPDAMLDVAGLSSEGVLYFAYPYSEGIYIDGGDIVVPVPSSQDGNFASASIATAVCPKGKRSAVMQLRCALLRFEYNAEGTYSALEMNVGDGVLHYDFPSSGHGTVYLACAPCTIPASGEMVLVSRSGIISPVQMTRSHTLSAGTIYNLGNLDDLADFSASPATDLGAYGTANCYIITEPGDYKMLAREGNSKTAVDAAYSGLLWETVGSATAPAAGSLIERCVQSDGYIYFTVPSGASDGNALVAAYNSSDEITWSWHLWLLSGGVADQTYDEDSGFSGAEMMDRNLGALTADLKYTAFGLMYQFGRKDPFMGPSSASSSSTALAVTAGTAVTTVSKTGETGTVAYATAHPTEMIVGDSDWLCEADLSLWSASSKTAYDPCPPGYHIPYQNAMSGFGTPKSYAYGSDKTMRGISKTVGSETVYLPSAGFRNGSAAGGLVNMKYGYFWNEAPGGSNRAWKFTAAVSDNTAATANPAYSAACSVRCQKNATSAAQVLSLTVTTSFAGQMYWAPEVFGDGYPYGTIAWGDGSDDEELPIGSYPWHSYSSAGTRTVTITAHDADSFRISNLCGVSAVDLSAF